jgi:polyphosphate kinase
VYVGSADWMPRNLDRRIECVLPIDNQAHRQTIRNVLELMWTDNRQAWELQPDGRSGPRTGSSPLLLCRRQTSQFEIVREVR